MIVGGHGAEICQPREASADAPLKNKGLAPVKEAGLE